MEYCQFFETVSHTRLPSVQAHSRMWPLSQPFSLLRKLYLTCSSMTSAAVQKGSCQLYLNTLYLALQVQFNYLIELPTWVSPSPVSVLRASHSLSQRDRLQLGVVFYFQHPEVSLWLSETVKWVTHMQPMHTHSEKHQAYGGSFENSSRVRYRSVSVVCDLKFSRY